MQIGHQLVRNAERRGYRLRPGIGDDEDGECCTISAIMQEVQREAPELWILLLIFGVRYQSYPSVSRSAWFLFLLSGAEGRSISYSEARRIAERVIDSNDRGRYDDAFRAARRILVSQSCERDTLERRRTCVVSDPSRTHVDRTRSDWRGSARRARRRETAHV